ncbi:MAG TPA: radical SAM protein [Sedimentisphaerales bacterium]|nr:radical SAM protein [Sedimentisphaerales bacterium]
MTVRTTDKNKREYIYGPVPSRRLGRSLGVDFVPFKTCTYDCIYCQLGRTANKTTRRSEWIPLEIVIKQLKSKLYTKPDYITISGSGEPTLYSKVGEAIRKIKEITDIPIAVLTNGSLLWLPEVRNSLMAADLVLPSLDAGSDQLFRYINRPHRDISFNRMLEGLVEFRDEYAGRYWLEVFLLSGVTTVEAQINMLAHCIKLICPDKVQINTVTRPAAEDFAIPVPANQLKVIARQLYGNVEIIADYQGVTEQQNFSTRCEDILTLLKRRPCCIEDIAAGLGLHRNEAVKCVEELSSVGRIEAKPHNQQLYYQAVI